MGDVASLIPEGQVSAEELTPAQRLALQALREVWAGGLKGHLPQTEAAIKLLTDAVVVLTDTHNRLVNEEADRLKVVHETLKQIS